MPTWTPENLIIIHTAITVIPLRDITKGCSTELVGDSSFEKARSNIHKTEGNQRAHSSLRAYRKEIFL